jgi:orotidine-5'-phosphate decarboxylase
MTQPDSDAFLSKNASDRILEIGLELGVKNFVAPANKPERLRTYKNIAKEKERDIKILSPGVGPQGGDPDLAVKAGADFVITGRAIYESESPRREIIRIYNLIGEAYKQ